MDVNALSREFYSTDPSANYSAHDTFNLLLLMVCFAQRFSHGTIICKNGVGLHLQERNMLDIDGEEPRKVRIYFYEDKIYYWFHNMMHHLHTCAYCEVYLSLDEFNGKCILDEGGVEESLHKKICMKNLVCTYPNITEKLITCINFISMGFIQIHTTDILWLTC